MEKINETLKNIESAIEKVKNKESKIVFLYIRYILFT